MTDKERKGKSKVKEGERESDTAEIEVCLGKADDSDAPHCN